LFDLPSVAEGAREQLAAAGLAGRCRIESGDFFQRVPQGADAMILKHVIHDWNDERALTILQRCRAAARRGAVLLIIETVSPARFDASALSRGHAYGDVNMMVNTGGRQRTETEFRALLAAAGFTFVRIVTTSSPHASIVEALADGD